MAGRAKRQRGFDWLDALPDHIARHEADYGEPFTVELDREPKEYERKLLATLGARWTVKAVKLPTNDELDRRVSEIAARLGAAEQPMTVRCICGWSYFGAPEQAIALLREHRTTHSEEGIVANQNRDWTPDEIVEAIRRWATEHGSWPRSSNWQIQVVGYPTYNTVRKHFGSWSEALAAAGCDTSRADYLTAVPVASAELAGGRELVDAVAVDVEGTPDGTPEPLVTEEAPIDEDELVEFEVELTEQELAEYERLAGSDTEGKMDEFRLRYIEALVSLVEGGEAGYALLERLEGLLWVK